MPTVSSTLTLSWNLKTIVSSIFEMNYGLCIEQIHLAKYVELKDGTLRALRSRNQYNVFYRAIGNEFDKFCAERNQAGLNLFLNSANFFSLKTKWSKILDFVYRDSYSEDQYRNLLRGFRDMYLGHATPGNIKRSLQTIVQLDSNLVEVYEFWKDSAIMGFFTNNWLIRNDAVFIISGTITSANFILFSDNINLTAFADGDLVGFQAVITSGVSAGQVRTIVSSSQAGGTVILDSVLPSIPFGETYTITQIRSERNSLNDLRPILDYYIPFGLTNYGFQVWVTIDDYLNVANFIVDIVKKIRPAHTIFSIAYVLHKDYVGSLTAALLNPVKNPVFVAVGTGDPAWDKYNPQPTGGESALYAEVSRKIGLINFLDGNEDPTLTPTERLEISGFFLPGEATSERIMEVGLFAEDGTTMLDYRAFSAIDKKSFDAFIWKFRQKYDSP